MFKDNNLPDISVTNLPSSDRYYPMPRLPWLLKPDLIFWQVKQLSRFWESPSQSGETKNLWDITCQLAQGIPSFFGFLMAHHKGRLIVGWASPDTRPINGLLEASYPGLLLNRYPDNIKGLLRSIPAFSSALVVTGNPSNPVGKEAEIQKQEPPGLETLVQGLKAYDWLYTLFALPLDEQQQRQQLQMLYAMEAELRAGYLRPGTALERNNPSAEAAMRRLEIARTKLEAGLNTGLWHTSAILHLVQKEGIPTAVSLFRSLLSGKDSLPQPIQVHICLSDFSNSGGKTDVPFTVLNAHDLARFILMPKQEYQGYAIRSPAVFDVHQSDLKAERRLLLGNLVTAPHAPVYIDIKELPKHMLISGTTGAGKTNTCLLLLSQAWKLHKIPFIVIETSEKNEYGKLLDGLIGKDMQVFTLGDESRNPLHLDFMHVSPAMHVEAHLGHLMRIFKAAFPLPPPTPYILEDALQEWYKRSGWNLEKNERPSKELPFLFSDLNGLIRELLEVKYANYDGQTKGNIESALLARLDTLNRGGVGKFLGAKPNDEKRWNELLQKPVVMELGTITDPDKKALVVLFLLYRIMSSAQEDFRRTPQRLHVTVVEEAHRILKQREPSGHPDVADTQAAVVEEFANALAEVRYAGESLIILDQMPSKLTPAVRSNTNLKLAHRLPDQEEQRCFAEAAGLTDQQRKLLYRLKTGEALWFPADGGSFHLEVHSFSEIVK